MASTNIGQLEADALKRKERLNALKRRREESSGDNVKSEDEKRGEIALPKPKFRSYQPEDDNLQENTVPAAKPGDVEQVVQDLIEAGKANVVIEDLDLTTLAPRKPDWDLKRDVAQKLQKLERRTQRAIAALIRERLRENNGETNLAEAVALEGATTRVQDDNDD